MGCKVAAGQDGTHPRSLFGRAWLPQPVSVRTSYPLVLIVGPSYRTRGSTTGVRATMGTARGGSLGGLKRVVAVRRLSREQPIYRTAIERPPADADPRASPHAHGTQHARHRRQRAGPPISARFRISQRASAPAIQGPGPARQWPDPRRTHAGRGQREQNPWRTCIHFQQKGIPSCATER
jgi:hypothetical protein